MRSWIVVLVLVAGCGGKAKSSSSAEASPPLMDKFELLGYTLSGAEYWPYKGTVDIDYPKEVLWGFYPKAGELPPGESDPNLADASPKAIACAERAYAALRTFLSSDPPLLRRIIEQGADQGYVPKFYLWTNDYTQAATPFPPGEREARLWYWKRKTPDPERPPGYWKWESVLNQKGECWIPEKKQIDEYLEKTLAELK